MKPTITFDDFAKLDIRTALITAAEPIDGADKLLKLTLDAGELGEPTVVAGIKAWYTPENLVGKTIIFLANLEPRTLRGVESQGMVLAVGAEEAVLLVPQTTVAPGVPVR